MSIPVLVLRPEPGNSSTTRNVQALGLEAISFPLFEASTVPWQCPDTSEFDGVLITSANGIYHAGPQLTGLLHLPVYAVGPATAKVAKQAGFSHVEAGPSNVNALIQIIEAAEDRPALLHLCGANTSEVTSTKLTMYPCNVYKMIETETRDLHDFTAQGPIIAMLHSPKAAARFASVVGTKENARSAITLVAISAAAARAAGKGWQRVAIAAEPRDEAMLILLSGLVCAEEEQNE